MMKTNVYRPKTRAQLDDLIEALISERGYYCSLNDIDVSLITNMSWLFGKDAVSSSICPSRFNGDISRWNTKNVTNMKRMFEGSKFMGNISGWDTGRVKNMSFMFSESQFNGDISRWNVENVEDMCGMFSYSKFNRDISCWDTRKVKNMCLMFAESQFNGDISYWDVENVENMSYMFCHSIFNQDISSWDTGKVKNFAYMFHYSVFNQDISNWNVRNAVRMTGMFYESQFHQDISSWKLDSKKIKSLSRMFFNSDFHGNIENWKINPSSTSVRNMFGTDKECNNSLVSESAKRFCNNNGISQKLVESGKGDDYNYYKDVIEDMVNNPGKGVLTILKYAAIIGALIWVNQMVSYVL